MKHLNRFYDTLRDMQRSKKVRPEDLASQALASLAVDMHEALSLAERGVGAIEKLADCIGGDSEAPVFLVEALGDLRGIDLAAIATSLEKLDSTVHREAKKGPASFQVDAIVYEGSVSMEENNDTKNN
jgi:hypothetical protein